MPRCHLVGSGGKHCTHFLDKEGNHAVHCPLGGATLQRHHALAKVLGEILKQLQVCTPRYEQRTPTLDRYRPDGTLQKAIMDITIAHPTMGSLLIDVAVVSATAGNSSQIATAGRKDGAAAARAVEVKKQRYNDMAIPFVLEIGGRPSGPAIDLVRRALRNATQQEEDCDRL
jgi:hypothetical protein